MRKPYGLDKVHVAYEEVEIRKIIVYSSGGVANSRASNARGRAGSVVTVRCHALEVSRLLLWKWLVHAKLRRVKHQSFGSYSNLWRMYEELLHINNDLDPDYVTNCLLRILRSNSKALQE